jgi:hypothetical protein
LAAADREARYLLPGFVIFRQRVSAGSLGVLIYRAHGSLKGSLVDRHDLALITATDARKSDPFTITKDSGSRPASLAAAT